MNSRNYVHKSAVEAGKRAAFVVVAALALTLPLQSQQLATDSSEATGSVSQASSAGIPDTQQSAPTPSAQTRAPNGDHTLTGNFFHRLAQVVE